MHGDACDPHVLHGMQFDAVACSFALGDIDDLDGAIATVARVLKPGGPFVFSMLEAGYFVEGWRVTRTPANGVRCRVGVTHRTLSTYVNSLSRAGLVLEEMREPPPPRDPPVAELVPVFLVARCRRSG